MLYPYMMRQWSSFLTWYATDTPSLNDSVSDYNKGGVDISVAPKSMVFI